MQLMSLQETADFLTISRKTLWNMIRYGDKYPPYVMIAGRKKFIRDDVERWIREQQPAVQESAQ